MRAPPPLPPTLLTRISIPPKAAAAASTSRAAWSGCPTSARQDATATPSARQERRDHERREQHANPRTKGQAPPQCVDEQPQRARMADDPIDTAGDQRMPGLDGDQPAEPRAEHKHGPEPQATPGREERDAQ